MEFNDNEKISLAITDNLTVHGRYILVDLKKIIGYGNGKKSSIRIEPFLPCLIVKDKGSYRLLNAKNPVVHNLLSAYDGETKVNFFLINDKKMEFEIEFITGELLPQQSPEMSYEDFFRELASCPRKQQAVLDYFCPAPSPSGSTLRINLDALLKLLGKNTPSRNTVGNYFKPKRATKKPEILKPTQLDNNHNANLNNFNSAEKDNYPANNSHASTPTDYNSVLKNIDLQDTTLSAIDDKHDYNFDINNELKEIWREHSSSQFSIEEVIKRLRKQEKRFQNAFIGRLQLDPESLAFVEFLDGMNNFMTDPKYD